MLPDAFLVDNGTKKSTKTNFSNLCKEALEDYVMESSLGRHFWLKKNEDPRHASTGESEDREDTNPTTPA